MVPAVRSIKLITEMANGAMPTHVHIVLLTRGEVLELAEKEVLLGRSDLAEPLVVWLTDDMETDTEMFHEKFSDIFARQGMALDIWKLGENE